jgi:small multidrug resistance family-3 protein
MSILPTFALYAVAALAEIVGCFSVWAWGRSGASGLWLIPGALSLAAFASLLMLAPAAHAGRAYAAYGGVYVATSLLWLWAVEGVRPDRYDLFGALIILAGTGVILLGPRNA